MRDRRQARPNSNTEKSFHAHVVPARAAVPFERVFRPEELDVDDLAEAVRALLEHDGAQHLLSLPPRGTHVVEATETH